jgi:hypothetical protein
MVRYQHFHQLDGSATREYGGKRPFASSWSTCLVVVISVWVAPATRRGFHLQLPLAPPA